MSKEISRAELKDSVDALPAKDKRKLLEAVADSEEFRAAIEEIWGPRFSKLEAQMRSLLQAPRSAKGILETLFAPGDEEPADAELPKKG